MRGITVKVQPRHSLANFSTQRATDHTQDQFPACPPAGLATDPQKLVKKITFTCSDADSLAEDTNMAATTPCSFMTPGTKSYKDQTLGMR